MHLLWKNREILSRIAVTKDLFSIFQILQFFYRFQTSSGRKIWTNGYLTLKFWLWWFFISIFHNIIIYQIFKDHHTQAFSYFFWFLGAIALNRIANLNNKNKWCWLKSYEIDRYQTITNCPLTPRFPKKKTWKIK